jgi:hypothetical protein
VVEKSRKKVEKAISERDFSKFWGMTLFRWPEMPRKDGTQEQRTGLPTPTLPTPQRRELIDDIELEPADPALYDRFCHHTEEDSDGTT